jgi:hypothetical protein
MLLAAPQAAIIRAALLNRAGGVRPPIETAKTQSLNPSAAVRYSGRKNLFRRGYQALRYAKNRILNRNLRRTLR